jgi:DNA-binding NarL/FixJ family response regulator
MRMSIKVVLVDDHPVLRDALAMMLGREADFEVIGTADDGPSAMALISRQPPDVLVLDIAIPGKNGVDVTRQVRKAFPAIQVLILSTYMDKRFVREALRAGAAGYVPKSAATAELPLAIRAVAEGQNYLSPKITAAVLSQLAPDDSEANPAPPLLTSREREVLRLVAEGVRTVAIARRLGITEGTVEAHRHNVMQKLNLHSVAELTRYAVREGLTPL